MYFTPLSNAGGQSSSGEQLTPLSFSPSSVNVDSNRQECPSDGFNYPTFRLTNKATRVYLSEPLPLDNLLTYRPFAVANSKGWFAAIRKIGDAQDIIFGKLEELHNAFKNASEDDKGLFFPQRDLSLDVGLPTMLAFAYHDTRLIVGVDNGSLHVYDTAALFSPGSDPVQPVSACGPRAGSLRQITPNPGIEADLADIVAIVRSDGSVHLVNTKLESLGGWETKDVKGVAWSPKGKHLAIGLQSGDILTFAPSNKTTPNKHIPPATEGRLVGLNWLSPGHTFRLTYAPQIENEGESIQQIISLDARSNTLSVFNTIHPFTMSDRSQESHALILPHWDEDSLSDSAKCLIIVGDRASSDVEVLGGHNGKWHQHSQENPVTLPLDNQTEETVLLTLDVDLTDPNKPTPILYAYLNDGSLQSWYLDHSKPYVGMVRAKPAVGSGVAAPNSDPQDSAMDEKEAANVLTSLSSFNQPPTTSPFTPFGSGIASEQPSVFGAPSQSTPAFGQPSFGQTSAFGALSPGSSFSQPSSSQSTPSPFGPGGSGNAFANIASQRNTGNVFGSSSFGATPRTSSSQLAPPDNEMTREASMSDGTAGGFGGLSLGGGSNESPDKPKTSIFGNFGSTPSASQASNSAFGGLIKPAQGFGAFDNLHASSSNSSQPVASAFSPPQPTPHSAFGQTGFGKPAFGQPAFGQSGFGKPAAPAASGSGGFAAFASSSPSAFGSSAPAAPASGGFSAFASGGTSAFGSAAKQNPDASSPFAPKPDQVKTSFTSNENNTSPFGTSTGTSAFGGTGNGASSFASSFGLRDSAGESTTPQGSPIKPAPSGAMSPPSSPEPDGLSSPLDRKKNVATPAAPTSGFLQQSSSGLGALGSMQESSPFFKKQDAKTPAVTAFGNFSTGGASKPPATMTTSSGFGAPSQLGMTKSAFGAPAFGATSQLGTPKPVATAAVTTTPPGKPPISGGFGAFSGGGSGFSAFAGPKSSFSDLLKSGGDSKEAERPERSQEDRKEEPATPSKPVSVFATSTPTTTRPAESTVSTTPKAPPPVSQKREESTTPKGPPPGEEQSFSASVSSIGSFVEVSPDKSYDELEKEEGDEEEGDDTQSFLSSDFSSGPPSDEEASDEEDETVPQDKEKGKTPVPPEGRAPSPTPQPEAPSVQVSPFPPADAAKAPPTKVDSTTPPGSPEVKPGSKSPSPTPQSTPSTPSTPSPSPFVVGLGRLSTRPARSSPLAAAPVSGTDEEEGEIKEENAPKPSMIPKPIFGKVKKEEDEGAAKRPGTPPLLTSFGAPSGISAPSAPIAPKPEPATAPVSFSLPTSHPSQPTPVFSKPPEPSRPVKQESPKPAPTSLFGGPPPKPPLPSDLPKTAPATPTAAPFSLPPFSLAPKPGSAPPTSQAPSGTIPPPVFAMGGPSVFGAAAQSSPASPPGQPPAGLFGKPPPPVPSFGQMPPAPSTVPLKPPAVTLPPPSPLPRPSVEEGMQKECVLVVTLVEKELKELGLLGARAAQSCQQLKESSGGSRVKTDLGVLQKWQISDATTFGQTLLQFQQDLVEMSNARETFKQTLRELNSSVLKANTRREEVARFNKANTDKDFAKMLSTRALGPEHLESQQHLRRTIRTLRDRVQQLESTLQQSKKQLSQASTGRPSIRAPTLDVINRTYRNIDMAIQQQTDEITKLSERVTKLKLGSTSLSSSTSRDTRLPDRPRRSITITPNVAVTTAAALNAERSAQKLKKALLRARKEPILNQKAALAPPPPVDTGSPHKPGVFSTVAGPLFSASGGEPETAESDLDLNLPEDNFNPGTPLPTTRRGAGSSHRKHGSVPLKKSSGGTVQSPPAAPTSDFWGPLPVFNNPPINKLAAEVKPMAPFVPLTAPGPQTPTPGKSGSSSTLPGGGFEAFIK